MLVTFWNKRGRGLIGLFGQIGHTTSSSAARAHLLATDAAWEAQSCGAHIAFCYEMSDKEHGGVCIFTFFGQIIRNMRISVLFAWVAFFFKGVMWFLFQPRTSLTTTTMTCYMWERWSAHVSHMSRRSPIFPLCSFLLMPVWISD